MTTARMAAPSGARVGPGSHLLVCGGAGFIGSCFVREILGARDGTRVTILDKLTYAGSLANLAPVTDDAEQAGRFRFVHGDIAHEGTVDPLVAEADAVVDFAAESHVDRSILDPSAFLVTGVLGVHELLEAVRRETELAAAGERRDADGHPRPAPRLLQVSTDEVYGSVAEGSSTESDPLAPRSPYAAAKAAGDLLVLAYRATHGLDVVITRGANTYGPYQHPEKLIPLFATNALQDLPLPLYGDGLQRRDWINVADHAGAVAFVLAHGESGLAYNVPGAGERTNREIVAELLDALGKPWSLVRTVPDRAGHDRRYSMDGSRIAALGWRPRVAFEDGLAETAAWYRDHEAWWREARGGDWDTYYERQYGRRLADATPPPPRPAAPRGAGDGPASGPSSSPPEGAEAP
jgi:dTDP-glucose 4,6-dehydratase